MSKFEKYDQIQLISNYQKASAGKLLSLTFLALLLAGAVSTTVHAQAYPNKPMRIIVGSAAGGPLDINGRLVAKQLHEQLGQQAVVENRTGAGGTIGAEYVVKSPADGYTLLMGSAAALCIAPAIYKDLRYDTTRDFAPITVLVDSFAVLVVNPSVPAQSAKELIAHAKSRLEPLRFGSAGIGSHTHLAMELFKSMSGIQATHIPYKGGAPALIDVAAGRTEMMMIPVVGLGEFGRQGKVRVLGLTSMRRTEAMPDLPLIADTGLPGYQSSSWYGVLAPAGTPRNIVMTLNGAIVKSLGTTEMKEFLVKQGLVAVGNTPEQFAALIKSELPKWARVVKESGATLGD
jgi:tripartite-type tricarboxylate transporter receptor subunit TctC